MAGQLKGDDPVTVYHKVMDGSTTLKDFELWLDELKSESYDIGWGEGIDSAQSNGL